jgi:hypothetical protein
MAASTPSAAKASSTSCVTAVVDSATPAGVPAEKQLQSQGNRSYGLTAARVLTRCQALVRKFLDRLRVLGKMRQPHAAQHIGRLGELDVVVAYDFETITPGVAEIEERAGDHLDAGFEQA